MSDVLKINGKNMNMMIIRCIVKYMLSVSNVYPWVMSGSKVWANSVLYVQCGM